MKPKQTDPQLSLFPNQTVTVTYWTHPFDGNGRYIRTQMDKHTERVQINQLDGFLAFLSIIPCKNVRVG